MSCALLSTQPQPIISVHGMPPFKYYVCWVDVGKCQHGHLCRIFENPNAADYGIHALRWSHPCSAGASCGHTDAAHLRFFSHANDSST
jgi:hypothetical protein